MPHKNYLKLICEKNYATVHFLCFAFQKCSKLEIFFEKQDFHIWMICKNRYGNLKHVKTDMANHENFFPRR